MSEQKQENHTVNPTPCEPNVSSGMPGKGKSAMAVHRPMDVLNLVNPAIRKGAPRVAPTPRPRLRGSSMRKSRSARVKKPAT